MDYSIAARRLESWGKTEGSAKLDMLYSDHVDPHAWHIGPTSLMLVIVNKQSGRILGIDVCHNIDKPKKFREWLRPMKYDLSDEAPNPAD